MLLLVLLVCRWQRFDKASIALIFAALTLYYFHFYHAQWREFTIDAVVHADYVSYIAQHNSIPTPVLNSATRHPPAYYIMAAAFYKLAAYFGEFPLPVVRHFSMVCFVLFVIMGIGILRQLLPPPSGAYYASLVMLLFWPIGVTMGSRIICDILLYATEAGALYSLVIWCQRGNSRDLAAAFLWSGASVLAKSNGVLMLFMSAGALTVTLIEQRRDWRSICHSRLIISILVALLCCLLTFYRQHNWTTRLVAMDQFDPFLPSRWSTFCSFNLFLFVFDTPMGLSGPLFWNMLLHSLVLGNGDMLWKSDFICAAINVCWLAVLVYIFEGLIHFGRILFKERVYILMGIFILISVSAMVFMRVRIGNAQYSDARYIYPVVIAFIVLFGKITDLNQHAGRGRLYKLGLMLAGSFFVLTPTLFLEQFLT